MRKKERKKAHDIFRNLACELVSRTYQIPSYKFISFLKLTHKRKIILESRSELIALSNGMWPTLDTVKFNSLSRSKLEKNLGLLTDNQDSKEKKNIFKKLFSKKKKS